MSTLKEKAQSILDEKNSKILPENIKSGIQIFNITGEYEGENISESRIVHFIKTYSKCTVYIETKADNSTILNSLNILDPIECSIVVLNRSDETVNIKINEYDGREWQIINNLAPGESRSFNTSNYSISMLIAFTAENI